MSSKMFYLVTVFVMLLGVPAVFAQFCCDVPVMSQHASFFECAISTPCGLSCSFCPTVGLACNGYYGYYYSCNPDGGDSNPNDLDIDVTSSCDGNVIFVNDNGNPVDGADVTVVEDISGDPVASGSTDSNGEFDFPGCPDNSDLKVEIEASKSGYSDEIKIVTLQDCSQCVGPLCGNNVVENGEQCDGSDVACSSSQKCSSCQCAPVECGPCQTVENHQCKDLCGSGQSCVNNQCKDDSECTSDLQCDPDQFCNIPPGQNGGSCKDLCEDGGNQCQCSQAVDHKLVPLGYECGPELGCPVCPEGMQCIDHKCVGSDISCPSTGIVGDEKTCAATECPNCDVEVTGPDGKKFTGKTDENGNFDLPLDLEGIYKVLLLKDGLPVKTVEIKAFPQSQPEEPEKPTGTGDDPFSLLWLLILLLLIILGIVYWRSRQQKK